MERQKMNFMITLAIIGLILVGSMVSAVSGKQTDGSKVVSPERSNAKIKNVIVMVPDGCDQDIQTLARWYSGEELRLDSMITDFLAFDEAVEEAMNFSGEDGHTLVIVFHDHNCGGMLIGNYVTSYTDLTVEELVDPLKGEGGTVEVGWTSGETLVKMYLSGHTDQVNQQDFLTTPNLQPVLLMHSDSSLEMLARNSL
ncbi:MAG: hypothetical protein JW705_02205 [Methanosarcinaceae archaeon]|nr:hypothetical protein [Methanosarcinaceae archaeon]